MISRFTKLLNSPQRLLAAIAVGAIAMILLGAALSRCSAPPPSSAYAASTTPAPAYASASTAPAVATVAAAVPAAPVVIQQAAPHSGIGDMITGAAIGSLATHALSSNRQGVAPAAPPAPLPQTINKTVIHKTTIVQAPPRQTVSLSKPRSTAYSTSSYRAPSSYASTRTTVSYSPSRSSSVSSRR